MDITIPEGVDAKITANTVKFHGKTGDVEKKFSSLLSIGIGQNKISIQGDSKALINSAVAHIKNMLHGVQNGYRIKLKIIFAHFPMNIEVKGKDVLIKNFLGEKQARKAMLVGNTKLEYNSKDQIVIISGSDKEAVGGTIANIRRATKIREKDPRVFQDGLYVIE